MKKPLRSFKGGVLLLFIAVYLLTNPAKAQQTLISVNGWNAYVHVPADYNSPANASKTFPTILFFPGVGEVGTNASAVILNGPGAYITQGWNGNVQVGTDSVEFIVISLQPPSAWPVETAINYQIQTLKSLYRINTKRLYLTGLSMGGWCATTFVTGDPYGGPYTYASQVAAIVDVEGVVPDDNQPYPTLFDNFALSGGRLVGFQQMNDNRDIPSIVGRMNQTVPNSSIFIQTNYGGGGHCCWEQFYGGLGVQPGVFSLDGVNQTIYQWLARQNAANIAPVATAGADQSITLPTSSVTLKGGGTDADGTVVSYAWSEIGGPIPAIISNPSSTQTTVSGLIEGVYQFTLTVADNGGAVGHDTMQVVVSATGIACNTSAPVTYKQGQSGPGAIYLVNGGPWKGGDTIRITPGNYSDVIEFDHVHGDPCHPVTIINDGGLVSSPAIRLKNDCYYVHLTGTGAPGIPYGFKVVNGPLTVSLSHHIECDHVEATNPGGVGIFLKVIPDTTAPGSWYINGASNNYLMNKLYIHDNWIHITGNEGMYIGATDPDGGQHGNDAFGKPLLPLRLDSVEISNNIVEYTGWDGIQLSNARDGAKIHDNIIRHFGLANAGTQQAGIILGGNTSGSIYNNKITQGTGNGIEAFGYGAISIYNNLLDSVGVDSTAKGQESYESDDYISTTEMNPKQQIIIYNNAFNHPQTTAAIRINSDNNNSVGSNIHDNTFCIPGAPATWQTQYIVRGAGGANVNNTLYCPTVVSPGVPKANAGADVTIKLPTTTAALSGSGTDANGQIGSYKWVQISGPSTGTIANSATAQTSVTGLIQGVYKFSLTVMDTSKAANSDTMQVTVSAANIAPVANAGADAGITLPVNSATLSGSATDADGTIASYQWAQVSGPSSATITNATAASTSVTGLVQGVYKFSLTVTDNNSATGKDTMQVTVNPAIVQVPVISSGATAGATSGKVFTYSITASNTPTSYGATGLPSGLSINTSTGVISGTPTVSGSFTVALSAINSGGTGTSSLVITINPPAPVISSATTASATSGKAFSYTITASNTPTSYAAASLPSGLSINTSTGVINGTPTVSGSFTVALSAINSGGTGTSSLVIIINPPAPVISSATTASATSGKAFSYTITASNTPTSYAAASLPSGLSINTSTGVINGTPTVSGSFTVALSAINSGGTGTSSLVITINPPAPVISSATTASGITGAAFTYSIVASNTPTSYSATGLPSGLSINTSTGVISGTPTVSGSFTVALSAVNSGGTGTSSLVITINPPAPVISSATTASAISSKVFTYTITASNTPTSYGATGLPSGLSINTSTGVISGTPTVSGSFTVALSAVNSGGTGTSSLVITINPPAPVISSATTASAISSKVFTYTITASNTPTSYGATGLPSGLSINTSTGVISGTPTVSGSFTVALSAVNSGGTGTSSLVITINPPAPVISSATTASAISSKVFTYTITASNTPTSYGATDLPSGLSINTSTGVISGTPTVSGSFTVALSAVNSGGTGTSSLVITINPPAPVISSATTASATSGKAFTYSITASNTPTSYGATGLPSGLSINTSTGVISGTPTVSGSFTVALSAINSGGTGTSSLVITINPPAPVISSVTTASGITGAAFTYTIAASNTPTSYGATGLPSGLSVNTSTGVISGTPTVSGSFTVALSAVNSGGTGTGSLAITINVPAPVLSNTATVSGTTNSIFTYNITGSNNPTSYGATGLPSGLSINTSTGVISGTPTVSGVFTVSLSATNSGGTGTSSLVITINPPAPVISSAATASGATGSLFTYTIIASNGPSGYGATGLPLGLSVNTTTGVISGTPTVLGVFTVTISAVNSGGTATGNLVITINPPAPVISSVDTASGITNAAFTYTIAASNNPTSYGATSLPSGLSINTATGVISGTPTVSGIYDATISAGNASGTTTAALTITIETPPVANAGNDQVIMLPTSNTMLNGKGTDAVGTMKSYQWSKMGGPASGTIMNATSPSTAVTNLAAGTYKFVLTVTNNLGATGRDTTLVTVKTQVTANAGADQTITLPANSVSLTGSGTSIGGTMASYQWVNIAGSATATITNAASANTGVTGLAQGIYQFALTVTDNFGATAKDTMQVIVNPAIVNVTNIAPVANAGADQTISLPVNSITLDGSGSDADGTIASWQWSKLSGPSAGVIANAASAGTAVTGLASGTYQFVLTVTDNRGAIGKDTLQVVVNIPPVVNAGTDQTVILPASSVILKGNSTDADGTITSYQWMQISGPSAIITNTGLVTTTVTGLSAGVYKFSLTVTDNNGAKGSDTVQVTVVANTPPVAKAGADQLITLPVNTVTLNGSGTDADGTVASYQWSKLSGPAAGVITNTTGAGTTVTGLAAGIYKFIITVTDNGGAIGKDTLQVTVNVAPVANAGTDQLITLPANSVTLNGSGTDIDGTIASYQWVKIAGPSTGLIATATTATTSITNLSAGVYKFELTVTDNNGATGKDTLQVTVNTAPVAKAGADQVITLPINGVILAGSGTDADGTIASYQWVVVSGPSTVAIVNKASAGTSISGLVQGVYKLELTVTDNAGAIGKDTLQIIVNTAPIANAGTDQIITLPTNSVSLSGTGVDVDGTIASYKWSQASGPSAATIANAVAAGTSVSGLTAGVYKFMLTVTDNYGGVGRDSVLVTVNTGIGVANNIPPTANAGVDVSIKLPVNSVTLNGSGKDSDGKIVSYKWLQVPGTTSAVIVNDTAAHTVIKGLSAAGIYQFILTVTDNKGATGKDTVRVTVKAANIPPVANAGADTAIALPDNDLTLNGTGTDVDGTIVSYHWTVISAPFNSFRNSIGNTNSAQLNLSGLKEGVYQYALMVTDNNGATAKDTVQVTVTANLSMEVFAGPNPVRSSITAQISNIPAGSKQLLVSLTNTSGSTMYSTVVSATQSSQVMQINMSNLKSGMYFLKIAADGAAGKPVVKTLFKQ